MNIFEEADWLAKPSKEQVAKEISYFGKNFENDDFFKAVYFISRGFTQDDIPELMLKVKIEQSKLLGMKNEMEKTVDAALKEEKTLELNVETQHSASQPFPDDKVGIC